MVQLKWMAVGFMAATLTLVPTGNAHAALITGVTASTNMGSDSGTNIQNTVNGVGLPGDTPSLTGIHAVATPSNSWASRSGTTTGNIDFNLNNLFNLNGFSFWNFSADNASGIQNVNILASTDGITYTPISGAPTQFAIGAFADPTPAQQYSFAPVLAQYVRFSVLSNYGGASAGFNEVQFDGTPIPTPALLPGLIGMGVAALRKRRADAGQVAEKV